MKSARNSAKKGTARKRKTDAATSARTGKSNVTVMPVAIRIPNTSPGTLPHSAGTNHRKATQDSVGLRELIATGVEQVVEIEKHAVDVAVDIAKQVFYFAFRAPAAARETSAEALQPGEFEGSAKEAKAA